MRNNDRRSANAHLCDRALPTFDFDLDTAGAIDEIALFNHELVCSVDRFIRQGAVVHKVSAERARGTSGRRILRNVVGWRDMRACAREAPTSIVSRVNG